MEKVFDYMLNILNLKMKFRFGMELPFPSGYCILIYYGDYEYCILSAIGSGYIYYDEESKVYQAELYETYSKRLNKDSIKTDIRKYELKSIYNLEYLMMKLILSDIKYVADMEKISYKMNPKASAMVDKGYLYFNEGKPASVLDGYTYYGASSRSYPMSFYRDYVYPFIYNETPNFLPCWSKF